MLNSAQVSYNYKNHLNTKKALVTGGEGFIGSHVVEALKFRGYQVAVLDRKSGFDIRTHDFWEKYETIYHLAARASIPDSFETPLETHDHNVTGTLRILEFARKTGAKVVFSSSSSVYGEPKEIPTTENCPLDPLSPYAVSKLLCEEWMKMYWKLGVKSVALRYFNVFGERQETANGGDSLALGIFLEQKATGKPLTIVGTGEQKRDFVYVKDVANANILASEWLDQADHLESFNIGGGTNYSINEIADMIVPKGKRKYLPPRPEAQIGLADISKAKLLKWEPKTKIQDWLSGIK